MARRRESRTGPVTGVASLPDIQFTQQELDTVVANATQSVAEKMGKTPAQLSADMKSAIKTAATSALNVRAKTIIQRDVDSAVKDTVLAGAKPLDLLDARMAAAKQGIGHIAADAKVAAILDDTAKLLWKKYQALKNNGFSESQSFDLLLAEVQGRASRIR